MIFHSLVVAVILGLVEGVTEFLPVSSTGHLIVASALLRFTGERADTFTIVIQLGAILAVLWHYRVTLVTLLTHFLSPGRERMLVVRLIVAFLPAAVIGGLLHGWIKAALFTPVVVATALIVGGIVMLLLEWRRPVITAVTVHDISTRQAFAVGAAQVLAMIPGTSRAAATILGGYAFGLSRPAATEFSFLLAIPTIVGAATLDLVKSRHLLTMGDAPMYLIGLTVAFCSALLVIRGFLRFVERHSFVAFAWYRIAFGGALFALFAMRIL
jgi:undecaprenyl-diphosphatase